jgi:hypothetical protein
MNVLMICQSLLLVTTIIDSQVVSVSQPIFRFTYSQYSFDQIRVQCEEPFWVCHITTISVYCTYQFLFN